MTTTWMKFAASLTCLAAVLTACNTQGNQKPQAQSTRIQSQAQHNHEVHNLSDTKVIPNFGGPKVQTTNPYGTTYTGMGNGIYSRIGTSSLHDDGATSTLENRLHAMGLTDLKVVVLGDSVYIGDPKHQIHGKNNGAHPSKLLSPNAGSSGKGMQHTRPNDPTVGSTNSHEDKLDQIKNEVRSVLGDDMQIYIVQDQKALQALDRIKATLGTSKEGIPKDSDLTYVREHSSKQDFYTPSHHQSR